MGTIESSRADARRGTSLSALATRVALLVYALIAYATFLGTIGYFFLFVGGIVVPKTVDRGASPAGPALAIDVALILLFGLQHSIMARPAFKRRLARIVPPALERSTFVLVSGLILALIFWLWRPIPAIVWQLDRTAAIITGSFWSGVILAVSSTFVFSHTELFGLQQVRHHLRGRPLRPAALRMPFLYRIVRHPMHLGMLVVLWATPLMTAGHLLFALAMTAYVLIGMRFEEKDLIREFGDSYRAYRTEVPAVVPFLRPQLVGTPRRRRVVVAGGGALLAVGVTAAAARRADTPNAEWNAVVAPLPRDSARVDGRVRTYAYYVPATARSGAPVLIGLHGTGGSGERLRTFTSGELERLADRYGFVVAYPDAIGGAWNECRAAVSTVASRSGVNDVAMIARVAGQLARRTGADSMRVFALGYSGGGHLAYRLALSAPDALRGAAVFGANLPVDRQLRCEPAGRAIPVMIANGTQDLINPYGGGTATGPFGQQLGRVRSARESAAYFAALTDAPVPLSDDLARDAGQTSRSRVGRTLWAGRDGIRVALYTVRDGGHVIPGPETRFPWLLGTTERGWSGLTEAIRFFGLDERSGIGAHTAGEP